MRIEPARLTLTRADQWAGSAHRHTVWINGYNAGLHRNGATVTYKFMPALDGRNTLRVVAYRPIGADVESNVEDFVIGSGGELTANVEFTTSGLSERLSLSSRVIKEGTRPPGDEVRIEAAVAAAAAEIDDPSTLMPDWYRRSLRAHHSLTPVFHDGGVGVCSVSVVKMAQPKVVNPLLDSSLLVGLLVFPLLSAMIFWREVLFERGLLYTTDTLGVIVAGGMVLIAGVAGPYLMALLAAGLISAGSTVVCPIAVNHGTYIPFHYVYVASLWFIILLVCAFVSFLYMVYPVLRLFTSDRPRYFTNGTQVSAAMLRRSRLRYVGRAAVKAFFVAGAGALGKQFGDWAGGVVAVIIVSAVAAWAEPISATEP